MRIGGITHAALVRMRPQRHRADDAAELLDAVLRLSTREPGTAAAFLLRFDDGAVGLLDLFRSEPDRRVHLTGPARQAIAYRSRDLFDTPVADAALDVLAHELPTAAGCARLASGTWLTFDDPDGGTAGNGSTGDLRFSVPNGLPWIALRSEGGAVAVVHLAPAGATDESGSPERLADVHRGATPLRLASATRFRLLGPDVPEEQVAELRLPDLDLTPRSRSRAEHDTVA